MKPKLKRPATLAAAHGSAFRAGTGLMGSTEPGQRVTQRNVRQLPAGSVVRLDGGGRLIHLHDEVWLYCSDCAHCYDGIENLKWRLPGELCHLPPNARLQGCERSEHTLQGVVRHSDSGGEPC